MTKHVLMSGATRGIGRAAALALAAKGYTVFAGASSERTAAELADVAGERIVPVVLDVSDPASVDAAVARVRGRLDGMPLHALVSNAGVDTNGPLTTLDVGEISTMINVNLLGAILLARAALPLMAPGRSRIVFVGSAMGLMAVPLVTVYASTKWGLEGLSDALRLELGMRDIPVALVEPGVVQTPMTANGPAILERMLARMDSAQRATYEPLMRRIVSMSSDPGKGIGADAVAKVIERAISAAKPKSRYRVGMDARIVGVLRHLPDAARDFLQRKSLGL